MNCIGHVTVVVNSLVLGKLVFVSFLHRVLVSEALHLRDASDGDDSSNSTSVDAHDVEVLRRVGLDVGVSDIPVLSLRPPRIIASELEVRLLNWVLDKQLLSSGSECQEHDYAA